MTVKLIAKMIHKFVNENHLMPMTVLMPIIELTFSFKGKRHR
jgi:hypothetical protein